ncbi:uncharacterized protein pgfb [Pseudorasbora parva]|uniref:uncharacterized protein pgfb n=1 Tax=Pseudorasbora parva TaxID=51549 RepID=UPI00351E490B
MQTPSASPFADIITSLAVLHQDQHQAMLDLRADQERRFEAIVRGQQEDREKFRSWIDREVRTEAAGLASAPVHVPLHKMGPQDDPEAFIDLFQKAAEACGWPRAQWPVRLIPLLTGEAQAAAQQLPVANLLEYDDLKKAILQRVGRSPEQHRQRFRSLEGRGGMGPGPLGSSRAPPRGAGLLGMGGDNGSGSTPSPRSLSNPLPAAGAAGRPGLACWRCGDPDHFVDRCPMMDIGTMIRIPDVQRTTPDQAGEYQIPTDASDRGLGAVLAQEVEGGERPVLYISRKLSKREAKYSTIEKECLAIRWAVLTLRYYLLGREFTAAGRTAPRPESGGGAHLLRTYIILSPTSTTLSASRDVKLWFSRRSVLARCDVLLLYYSRTRLKLQINFDGSQTILIWLWRSSTTSFASKSSSLVNVNSTAKVMLFQEVWGKSFCRTIEKLVEVVQEYPGEVEHIFSPACVPLVRCAGCCGDENLECHPTLTSNTTMQLLKIKPAEQGQEYVEMTFVEHKACECRLRKPTTKQDRWKPRNRGRKRKEKQRVKDCDRCQPPRR